MPAANSLPDPLDRDHLARLVGRASELRRALTIVAERIAIRQSDQVQPSDVDAPPANRKPRRNDHDHGIGGDRRLLATRPAPR
jgi:hypothetical protein